MSPGSSITHIAPGAPEHDDHLTEWPWRKLSKIHEFAFIFLLCMAQGATQWCLAISIVPLHYIGATFHITDPGQLSWMAAAFSLTVGTFILVAGRLGDLFGHKNMFILGWLWLSLWSVIAGLSAYTGNAIFFDVCRAMQGIGPALLFPNAMALIGRCYEPGERKDMMFAMYGLAAPSGFVVGAVFSGLFSQFAWWPWSYWTNALFSLLFALLSLPLIPSIHTPPTHPITLAQLDPIGCITGVSGLVLVNFAWNQGPVVGWGTAYVPVLLVLGLACVGGFFWWEGRAEYPLVPIKVLTREILLVLAAVAAGWSSFGIWIYYLWQMLLNLRRQTPLLSAAHLSPCVISGGLAAVTTGLLISRVRPGWLLLVSMTAFTVGNILLAMMPIEQVYWAQTFVAVCVTPWGMDMSFPAANIIMSNFMPRHQQGLSASLVNTVINYSISIGLGIAGTVESRVIANGGTELQGFRSAWYVAIGLGALGMGVSAVLLMAGKPVEAVGEKPTLEGREVEKK